ncbi:MAG TPA: coenzyme F420-0:L-glutamate ligase, partial [Nitrososphaera sp.]|nr:coenzyme F420-0:L-glutamate ligase [Nitrososphaera sp.]
MAVEILPIRVPVRSRRFDLFKSLAGFEFQADDILVISSKYVSISEGRTVKLSSVKPSARALAIAKEAEMEPFMAELVLRESDYILRGVAGFLLTIKDGMIAPNAGIDRSNVPHGYAVLYPTRPFESAHLLRRKFQDLLGIRVGI